jgi:hypothetical protein
MACRACVLLLSVLAVIAASANETFAGEATATGKERLSDKASDNQRTDNCRVPIERRGIKPRPDCGQRETARPPGHEPGNAVVKPG